jgi:hypothetical protein
MVISHGSCGRDVHDILVFRFVCFALRSLSLYTVHTGVAMSIEVEWNRRQRKGCRVSDFNHAAHHATATRKRVRHNFQTHGTLAHLEVGSFTDG